MEPEPVKASLLTRMELSSRRQKKATRPTADIRGGDELDPQNFIDVIREIALYIRGRLPNDPVQAVVFSSHGETIIPVGYGRKSYSSGIYECG